MKLPSTVLFAALLATSCSFSMSGNHRLVGKVDGAIVDAQTIDAIQVDNRAGKITIRACEAAAASVEVEVLLTEDRLESEFVADFEEHAKLDRTGSKLMITNAHARATDEQDWQLHFTINVPTGLSVTVNQIAGEVDVRLPSAKDVSVDTTAGVTNIAIADVTGKVTADAAAGQITVSVSNSGPTDGCDLDCTTGTVTLALPKGTSGMFDLRSTTGDVSVAKSYGLKSERSVTTVSAKGRVGNGGPTFHAHTVTGTVSLR
jgi:DUF4097 and DUF4098 domain-containing protein YvlB